MGLESSLRAWALRSGLQRSPAVVGAYRLVSRIRFSRSWDKPVTFRGASFRIGKDLSLYPAVRNGGFEAYELDAFLSRVRPGDVVWDVGGNIGIYSVLLGRAAHDGHVVAFEPVPSSRERLAGNLALNDVANVTVEPLALSDVAGEASMAIYPDAPGCDHIVAGSAPSDAPESLRVTTTTGAQYAATSPHGQPDVVKVDIEGHEPEFFRGTWDIISSRRPTLLMEVNPHAWSGPERADEWQQLIDDLFAVYGEGLQFDAAGGRRTTTLDVTAIGPGAVNLMFPAA